MNALLSESDLFLCLFQVVYHLDGDYLLAAR